MSLSAAARQACLDALTDARLRLVAGDAGRAFALLEKAHVLGQTALSLHWRVHVAMLRVAVARRDKREIAGQLLRLALTPLGHLSGRLPRGNTGGSDVNPFAAMPIPDELQALLDQDAPLSRRL